MRNVIISHKSCMDGTMAALVAEHYFRITGQEFVTYYSQYGDPIPELQKDDFVYVLDFSYNRQVCIELENKVQGLIILDHHKTAEKELKDLLFAIFDMTESGCTLAWNYFFHDTPPVPVLLLHVKDRDIWKWELEGTNEISLALSTMLVDYSIFCRYLNDVTPLIEMGKPLVAYQNNLVASIARNAKIEMLDEYPVPVVNSSIFQSEVGNLLCKEHPNAKFAAIYFHTDPVTRVFSLRSIGDFDVSEIAKQHGGGGHRNAAGFTVKIGNDYQDSSLEAT